MARQLSVGGTSSDIARLLMEFESKVKVKYTLCGRYDDPVPPCYSQSGKIPNLGKALYGRPPLEAQYLILPQDAEIAIRRIDTDSLPFAVDQMRNPESVVYVPCGLHQSGAIIIGTIGTIGTSDVANNLYREFRMACRRTCTSLRGNWLGPEAYQAFKQGVRIAFDVKSPPEYDLQN